MKGAFYPKLALDGIRKNKRLYIPYILTCVGMVTMFYIITFLQKSETVGAMRSGSTVQRILSFGIIVIAVFACIFLFYTNSFLMKRRKKEFGLYNILGMGKRNIGIILVWESLIIALFSLAVGLFIGIAISKLAELALVNILNGAVKYSFSISPLAIVMTVAVFGAIFLLLLLNSIRQIRFSNTAALLRSENLGEKPPKGNIFIGIVGILLLGGAYWLAVSIKDPIAAMLMFFIAVIMVILGTYLTMIAGSVSFCRILQKNKKYYYKPSHFVSVSSMAYRMKRNGAGLASVCILATMVLVRSLQRQACISVRTTLSKNSIRERLTQQSLSEEQMRRRKKTRQPFAMKSQKRRQKTGRQYQTQALTEAYHFRRSRGVLIF